MASYGYLLPTRGIVLESESREALTAATHADIVGLARRVEAAGFDAVWVGDSVLAKPRLEPLTTLAGVATATDAVDLGTAVYLPNLRHPVCVAHQTATLDQLSGGRLRLGVGVGVGPDVEAEHDQLDVPFRGRGRLLDETLDVITRLWAGESVTHHGTGSDPETADLGIRPNRSPPVYVASAKFDPSERFPVSIRDRIAIHGDGWLPFGLDPETYADGLDRIRGFLERAGRDPERFDPAYYLDIAIGKTERAALRKARAFLDAYYPSYEFSDDDIHDRGVFGPPGRIRDVLQEYERAGVETFVIRFTAHDQREHLTTFTSLIG